jgi:hypothetical protein
MTPPEKQKGHHLVWVMALVNRLRLPIVRYITHSPPAPECRRS